MSDHQETPELTLADLREILAIMTDVKQSMEAGK